MTVGAAGASPTNGEGGAEDRSTSTASSCSPRSPVFVYGSGEGRDMAGATSPCAFPFPFTCDGPAFGSGGMCASGFEVELEFGDDKESSEKVADAPAPAEAMSPSPSSSDAL
jgi:hypothetical protein